ncbi:MerR family transcriptional regulator [Erysipelothrix sp. HDW6C]|uniref:MerR family transcriptional regulator n=1 Tax=Erysipelothrix sp. HDW6C TaxID=2714930 RepID=UPI00140A872D|nr:MerR family transcriptional regulator [Erysipelothrix sp. HDW6C]QIK70068.1 MerR family transcriptional regulator [Erysipelothrix sp. HDW6C]
MTYRPIDIARKFNISTSTVRNYEEAMLIPASNRTSNGYRTYTEKHCNYLRCVLAMQAGFGRDEIIDIVQLIHDKQVNNALLKCSEKQVKLIRELDHAQKTVKLFTSGHLYKDFKIKKLLTIQEASQLTDVIDTTIRHWEREGLLYPVRGKGNNYRLYDIEQITRILIIRTIKTATWSLDHVKDFLREFDAKNPQEVYKVAVDSLNYLYRLNIHQHQGIHALYELCIQEGLVAENYQMDYSFNINL